MSTRLSLRIICYFCVKELKLNQLKCCLLDLQEGKLQGIVKFCEVQENEDSQGVTWILVDCGLKL